MSLGARILVAAVALLFGGIMFLHGTTADPDKARFSHAFGAFCIFIAAASVLRGRAAQFCGSVVGLCVFLAGLLYLGHELLSGQFVSDRRSEPSAVNACLFLIVFGLPGVVYAINTRFGFGRTVPQRPARSDGPASDGPTT